MLLLLGDMNVNSKFYCNPAITYREVSVMVRLIDNMNICPYITSLEEVLNKYFKLLQHFNLGCEGPNNESHGIDDFDYLSYPGATLEQTHPC